MKALVLSEWLSNHADILERSCGLEAARGLRRLSDVLAIRPQHSVKDVCKALDKAATSHTGGEKVGPTAKLLRLLVDASCGFAKAADAADLKRFAASVEKHCATTLNDLASRASDALTPRDNRAVSSALSEVELSAILRKLEEVLGDERGFDAIYRQVSTDSRIKTPEAKKLAKAFAGKSGRSKVEALGLIYKRHRSLMGAEPKANATGRRLAG